MNCSAGIACNRLQRVPKQNHRVMRIGLLEGFSSLAKTFLPDYAVYMQFHEGTRCKANGTLRIDLLESARSDMHPEGGEV